MSTYKVNVDTEVEIDLEDFFDDNEVVTFGARNYLREILEEAEIEEILECLDIEEVLQELASLVEGLGRDGKCYDKKILVKLFSESAIKEAHEETPPPISFSEDDLCKLLIDRGYEVRKRNI